MNWDYREIVNWLKEFHPDIYDKWYIHTQPKRDLEAKRLKEKIDAIQKWLDEDTEINDDSRKVIQFSLDMFNQAEDNEQRRNSWNIMLAYVRNLPHFPYRRGFQGDEEE